MYTAFLNNLTPHTVAVPGHPPIPTATRAGVALEDFDFDHYADIWAVRAVEMGLVLTDTDSMMTNLRAIAGQPNLVLNAFTTASINAACRAILGIASTFTLTLPAATAVLPTKPIRAFAVPGTSAISIQRAGSDTVNGLTAAIVLNGTTNPLVTFTSDGVSNWTAA